MTVYVVHLTFDTSTSFCLVALPPAIAHGIAYAKDTLETFWNKLVFINICKI